MDTFLTINGKVHHGLTERRSQYFIAFHSGARWIGREAHWTEYVEIPPENDPHWKAASLFAPESLKPVLVILPQPIILKDLRINAGLSFAMFDDRYSKTWRVYHRNLNGRDDRTRNWIDIGLKRISSWLEINPMSD